MTESRDPDASGVIAPCEPLLALAGPDLYRTNPFRVLGVRVDIGNRDLQREQQRRKIAARLGQTVDQGAGVFAPSLDGEEQRAAFEALARPRERFLAELFWFWPLGDDDEALGSMADLDPERALAAWDDARDDWPVEAHHNLAVFYHALALEPGSDVEGDAERRPELAFRYWQVVLDDEAFWTRLESRAADMDDRRVTPAFVQQIRASLPTALLMSHAEVALAATRAGDADEAREHIAIIRSAPFDATLGDEAVREVLSPIRGRLQRMITDAKAEWARTPQDGVRIVRDLHRRGSDLLRAVDELLPPDDPTRIALHDDLAHTMLLGQVAYGEVTEDWETSEALLQAALDVVLGEATRDALERNLGIVRDRATETNRWCASGYWDLPDDVVAALEDAHTRVRAGDYERALASLAVMDLSIGYPLVRATAYTLSQRAWQARERAVADYNAHATRPVRRILDGFQRMSEPEIALKLMRRPDPNTFAELNPPCLACGRTGYTSWINLTHNDIPMFMCSRCGDDHQRDIDQAQRRLRSELERAYQHVAIACELDPNIPELQDNWKSLTDDLAKVDGTPPSVEPLRRELAGDLLRERPVDEPSSRPTDPCAFCAEAPGDEAAAIVVPMRGERERADFLFGTGVEFRAEDVVVPRCEACRTHHRRYAEQTTRYEAERQAARADEHFPELTTEVEAAREAIEAADAAVAKAQAAVERANGALGAATTLPDRCPSCADAESWDDGTCRSCDANVYGLDPLRGLLAAGIGGLLLANLFFGAGTGVIQGLAEAWADRTGATVVAAAGRIAIAGGGAVFVFVGALWGALLRRTRIERAELSRERLAEHVRSKAREAETAQRTLDVAEGALETARADAERPRRRLAKAEDALREAKDAAVAAYEEANPAPELPEGVQPEEAFVDFPPIAERVRRGWGFGPLVDGAPRPEPDVATGLVGRAA